MCLLLWHTERSLIVRRNARLGKALQVFVEFVGGIKQGFQSCCTDITNWGLNYVYDTGSLHISNEYYTLHSNN